MRGSSPRMRDRGRFTARWQRNRGEQRSLLVDPASSLTCQFVTFARSFAVALKNRRPRERRQPWCPRRHDEVMPSTPPRGSIHRVCGFPHERVVARVACCGCKRPIFDRPADAACRAGLVAWGASCSTTATPTEMRHDIVLRNKACGDTRACPDHGGDRLVCAKPAAILHPALRRVGGARGALLLNPPRPPTSGWIARRARSRRALLFVIRTNRSPVIV